MDHLKVPFETQQNSKTTAHHPFHPHLRSCPTKSSLIFETPITILAMYMKFLNDKHAHTHNFQNLDLDLTILRSHLHETI